MTKTLSQQICELCGIETKYREPAICNMRDYPGCLKANCKHYDKEQKICKSTPLSIDFENPENFVKLMELKFKHSSFWIDTFSCPKRKGFVSDMLENTIGELINFKSREKELIKAIRDYDGWVWG